MRRRQQSPHNTPVGMEHKMRARALVSTATFFEQLRDLYAISCSSTSRCSSCQVKIVLLPPLLTTVNCVRARFDDATIGLSTASDSSGVAAATVVVAAASRITNFPLKSSPSQGRRRAWRRRDATTASGLVSAGAARTRTCEHVRRASSSSWSPSTLIKMRALFAVVERDGRLPASR